MNLRFYTCANNLVRYCSGMSRLLFLFSMAFVVQPIFAAISISSSDTFATDNEGWQIGGAGTQPSRVASAGPDSQIGFLSHFSDGGGSQGKWLMWSSQSDWTGNYSSAGITGVSLAANVSAGTAPALLRIAFDGPGGWFFSSAQSVGSGWSDYMFSLNATNFTYATSSGGTTNFLATLSGVTRFEILAGSGSVTYRSGGDILQAGNSVNTILIDNIVAVPEPTTGALLVAGTAFLVLFKKRNAAYRAAFHTVG